jgi:tRNA 2-thiouridine synthesizing protein A
MERELDARGLKCPLPVLKARKALKSLGAGDALAILVTDPGAPADFAHFCAVTGTLLLGTEAAVDHTRITLRLPFPLAP